VYLYSLHVLSKTYHFFLSLHLIIRASLIVPLFFCINCCLIIAIFGCHAEHGLVYDVRGVCSQRKKSTTKFSHWFLSTIKILKKWTIVLMQ